MISDKACIKKAEKKADDLIKFFGIKEFPPDFEDICKKLGFILKFAENDKLPFLSGTTVYDEKSGKYIIIVNEKASPKTVAHEIGHIMLGHFENGTLIKNSLPQNLYSVFEQEADAFAARLCRI